MALPFLGEIRMFGGSFAPTGWALCDGAILQTTQNEALFSIIGTIYGGNGRTTFGLPDMRGRVPVHQGGGVGLTTRSMGQSGGTEHESLTVSQLPSHSHTMMGTSNAGNQSSGSGHVLATDSAIDPYSQDAANTTLASASIGTTGSGTSHTNLMPYQVVNYIIALLGEIPSQT